MSIKAILRKLSIGLATIASLSISANTALANGQAAVALSTPGTARVLNLPPQADNSNVIYLGTAVDPQTGQIVEGYAIVHFAKQNLSYKTAKAKPSGIGKGNTTCYGYLADGAKWKTLEPWVVNTSNLDSLDSTTVYNIVDGAVSKWEEATDGNVSNGQGLDVMGSGSQTSDILTADTASPDNKNEIYFGGISTPGAIAVTIVWGYFSGPTTLRSLVEWDQIYDDVEYDWATTGASDKMDVENIVTHEVGHGFGLSDLYNSTCSDETMYGYASNGETKKRTLNSGDIAGINKLY